MNNIHFEDFCNSFERPSTHIDYGGIRKYEQVQVSISSTFYARFFVNILAPRNYKAEMFGFVIFG